MFRKKRGDWRNGNGQLAADVEFTKSYTRDHWKGKLMNVHHTAVCSAPLSCRHKTRKMWALVWNRKVSLYSCTSMIFKVSFYLDFNSLHFLHTWLKRSRGSETNGTIWKMKGREQVKRGEEGWGEITWPEQRPPGGQSGNGWESTRWLRGEQETLLV